MGITYHIDRERGILFSRGEGVLTDEAVLAHQRGRLGDPELLQFDELADIRDVTRLDVTTETVRELAESARVRDTSRGARLAIVARTPEAFGMARMYQLLREDERSDARRLRVFTEVKEAVEWLGLPVGFQVPPTDRTFGD